MKKNRILASVSALLLAFALLSVNAFAFSKEEEEYGYSKESILVCITHDYSVQCHEYTVSDFDTELVACVRPIMLYSTALQTPDDLFNLEGFCDILELKLADPSFENIDRLIEKLNGKEFILCADKNYIYSLGEDELTDGIKGDVDLDGMLTPADARLVLRYSIELEDPQDAQTRANADYDNDGKITPFDAREILRRSVGK